MRKPLVAGNWKMNKLVGESLELVNALKPLVEGIEAADIVVCPVFTALYPVAQALKGSNIHLGDKNC